MTTWFSVVDVPAQERLVSAWIDAPTDNLETCGYLLDMARDQVWAYAPESVDDETGDPITVPTAPLIEVPTRLVLAQLRQAENLWNAGRVNSSGDTGMDSFTFTPRPLDKTIRQMIRPLRGEFSVG